MGNNRVAKFDHSLDTLSNRHQYEDFSELKILKLSVLWHPQRQIIGSSTQISFDADHRMNLSRFSPKFMAQNNQADFTLSWVGISRKSVVLQKNKKGILLIAPSSRMDVRVNAVLVHDQIFIEESDLKQGLSIQLGGQVVLWLGYSRYLPGSSPTQFDFIGISDGAIKTRQLVQQFGPTNATVLIRGETGTGKELVAKALHGLSARSNNPYISLNMSTLQESLAATELFGAVKGAYTGANRDKNGLFQAADKGTLFLDEIGDTPSTVQPMLLRVLEDGELRSVGSLRNQHTDVRVLAATDQLLESNVSSFNQPLLRRLESLVIEVTSLRERREDIGLLLDYFMDNYRKHHGCQPVRELQVDDFIALMDYSWPGNVRELRNRVQSFYLTGSFNLPIVVNTSGALMDNESSDNSRAKSSYRDPVSVSEEELICVLNANNWVIKPAALALNVSRTSFYSLLKSCTLINDPEKITASAIQSALLQYSGDLNRCAKALKTPKEGLRNRIKKITECEV